MEVKSLGFENFIDGNACGVGPLTIIWRPQGKWWLLTYGPDDDQSRRYSRPNKVGEMRRMSARSLDKEGQKVENWLHLATKYVPGPVLVLAITPSNFFI